MHLQGDDLFVNEAMFRKSGKFLSQLKNLYFFPGIRADISDKTFCEMLWDEPSPKRSVSLLT